MVIFKLKHLFQLNGEKGHTMSHVILLGCDLAILTYVKTTVLVSTEVKQ